MVLPTVEQLVFKIIFIASASSLDILTPSSKKTPKKFPHIILSLVNRIVEYPLCEHKIRWTGPSSVLFSHIYFCFSFQMPRRGSRLHAERYHLWEQGKLMERMSKKMSRGWENWFHSCMQLLGLAYRHKPKIPENLFSCIRYFCDFFSSFKEIMLIFGQEIPKNVKASDLTIILDYIYIFIFVEHKS